MIRSVGHGLAWFALVGVAASACAGEPPATPPLVAGATATVAAPSSAAADAPDAALAAPGRDAAPSATVDPGPAPTLIVDESVDTEDGLHLAAGGGGPLAPGHGGGLARLSPSPPAASAPAHPRPASNVGIGGATITVPIFGAYAILHRKALPLLRRCYDDALEDDPSQSGRIVFTIRVAPSGDPIGVSTTENTGLSQSVDACMERAIRRLEFNPPGASSVIVLPVSCTTRSN